MEFKDMPIGVHHLKSHPEYYAEVVAGKKPWELRLNDRDFRVGDKIELEEWDPLRAQGERVADGYTGRSMTGTIVLVVKAANAISGGLYENYVVLTVNWLL